jgi:hypothetical protein
MSVVLNAAETLHLVVTIRSLDMDLMDDLERRERLRVQWYKTLHSTSVGLGFYLDLERMKRIAQAIDDLDLVVLEEMMSVLLDGVEKALRSRDEAMEAVAK